MKREIKFIGTVHVSTCCNNCNQDSNMSVQYTVKNKSLGISEKLYIPVYTR